jgi:hypothetical protein
VDGSKQILRDTHTTTKVVYSVDETRKADAMKSLVKFDGHDSYFVNFINPVNQYFRLCIRNGVEAELYAPGLSQRGLAAAKHCLDIPIIDNCNGEYTYTRIVESFPSVNAGVLVSKYYRSLELRNPGFHSILASQSDNLHARHLRKLYGAHLYNAVYLPHGIQAAFSRAFIATKNILEADGHPLLPIGDTEIGEQCATAGLNDWSLTQLITTANLYIGLDCFWAQLAYNIGIPTYIVAFNDRQVSVRNAYSHVKYGDLDHAAPDIIRISSQFWNR